MECLDLHLKVLVLEHGRKHVLQSLAHICGVSEETLANELVLAEKNKIEKPSKKIPTSAEILDKLELPPAKRESMETLAREFKNKRFLGEMRLVRKFFREHQQSVLPRSRLQALPRVLNILASLPQHELDELLADCTNHPLHSEYSRLAGAIMGQE
jgi:hypothetical protein